MCIAYNMSASGEFDKKRWPLDLEFSTYIRIYSLNYEVIGLKEEEKVIYIYIAVRCPPVRMPVAPVVCCVYLRMLLQELSLLLVLESHRRDILLLVGMRFMNIQCTTVSTAESPSIGPLRHDSTREQRAGVFWRRNNKRTTCGGEGGGEADL